MKQTPVIIFWSGGIESYQTLREIEKLEGHKPLCLLSIIDSKTNLLPKSGVKESLLVKQAELLKIPLQRIYVENNNFSNLTSYLERFSKQGIRTIAISSSRENLFESLDLDILNPLKDKTSEEISRDFFQTEAKAIITSVVTEKLDNSFLAKEYDQDYIARLPKEIDIIGKNDEFKTFVYFGAGFKTRVPFSKSIGLKEGEYTVSHLKDA